MRKKYNISRITFEQVLPIKICRMVWNSEEYTLLNLPNDKLLTEVHTEIARMHQNANIATHATLYNLLTYLKIRNNLLELKNGRK